MGGGEAGWERRARPAHSQDSRDEDIVSRGRRDEQANNVENLARFRDCLSDQVKRELTKLEDFLAFKASVEWEVTQPDSDMGKKKRKRAPTFKEKPTTELVEGRNDSAVGQQADANKQTDTMVGRKPSREGKQIP